MRKNIKANQKSMPLRLNWPHIEWKFSKRVMVISYALAFIVFFFPLFAESDNYSQLRFFIGIPLLLSPGIVPVVYWGFSIFKYIILRVTLYPKVYRLYIHAIRELALLNRGFIDLIKRTSENRYFEIKIASFYDRSYFISIQKRKDLILKKNYKVVVSHISDNRIMGMFQVTDVRKDEYIANNIGMIDPVWAGYIRQRGEIHINPNLVATYLSEGDV